MEFPIYRFSKDLCDWSSDDAALAKKLLGGKGAALVAMAQADFPVPPGFTIPTSTCNAYRESAMEDGGAGFIEKLMTAVQEYDYWLVEPFGYAPLVSVRSGAPISMPGMMDTILNVGLHDGTLPGWIGKIGERAALDSYRRLIQMLGHTAYGVDADLFEQALSSVKVAAGVTDDADLDCNQLLDVVALFKTVFLEETAMEFPQTRNEQLRAAIEAVFRSWMNPRAIEYRKLNKIDEAMGTAVNVQAMVFGNMGETSGSGVLFTRDPSTGEPLVMAEYLTNAQGEDVVAGIRTPEKLVLSEAEADPVKNLWKLELIETCVRLEDMYKDMVDVEFTVQEGKLFILQSRVGKRSARAAFRIAVDLVEEGVIEPEQALKRITRQQFKVMRRPMIDPKFDTEPSLVGLPACPGVVTGRPVFSAEAAVESKEPCILISHETTPDDIAGMNAAVGILTQTGGATSHAAVVARAMDKACVVGCTALDLGADWSDVSRVTIDGATGRVWLQVEVPVVDASEDPALRTVTEWAVQAAEATVASMFPSDEVLWPQVVQAAHWWHAVPVLEAVVAELAEMFDQVKVTGITLDLRGPRHFEYHVDRELTDAFGFALLDDAFYAPVLTELTKHAAALAGLKVITTDAELAAELGKIGLDPIDPPVCVTNPMFGVPVDFAVFHALAA